MEDEADLSRKVFGLTFKFLRIFFIAIVKIKIIYKLLDEKKPKFIITNHGTVAHEFAYHNIPVINTGDNLHINYNFCLHAKSKKHLEKIILNFEKYKSKIKSLNNPYVGGAANKIAEILSEIEINNKLLNKITTY